MATLIQQGSFTADGSSKNIQLPAGASYFKTFNLTQAATQQSTGRGVEFEWFQGVTADDAALETKKTNSTDAMNLVTVSSGGFTYYTAPPAPGAAVTGTAITAASPAVVSMTNTYSEGDTVILYGTTGMLQISGMAFTISSVSSSAFTLLGLDASGFAAAATGVTARKVDPSLAMAPRFNYVTKITKASSAVVTLSMAHSYVVGQLIHFSVPSSFGMTEMDQLTGKITAVGTYTVTVDIDSSAFTTFAFPASSGSPTAALFATVAPAGSRNVSNPTNPFVSDQNVPYMHLASGAQSPAGSSSDVIVWQAWQVPALSNE